MEVLAIVVAAARQKLLQSARFHKIQYSYKSAVRIRVQGPTLQAPSRGCSTW